jgi:hypothetical protein
MLLIYHTHLQEYLSPEQIVFIEMLLRVIQVFKEIKIEKLAGRIPLPIKFESRRKAIQRFLLERVLEISLIWLPIIKQIVDRKMSEQKHRIRGVHLAAWLTQLKIKYVFRIKGDTWVECLYSVVFTGK